MEDEQISHVVKVLPDCFISYSRADRTFVEKLVTSLTAHDITAWVDLHGILPSEEWLKKIQLGIETAKHFVFIISPDSVTSSYCQGEVDHAVNHSKRLIPVLYRDIKQKDLIPKALKERHYIFCRAADDFDKAMKELVDAINNDPEWINKHRKFLWRANEWNQKGKNRGLLLRGEDLAEAEQWLTEEGVYSERKATILQKQYIHASRENAKKTQQRIIQAIASAFFVAVILLFVAWQQQQEAKRQSGIALSRQLGAQAVTSSSSNLGLALLLSLEANRLTSNPEVKGSLWTILESNRQIETFLRGHQSSVEHVVFHPSDTNMLASVGNDGKVFLWDLVGRKQQEEITIPDFFVTSIAFHPGGNILALGSQSPPIIVLWDITARKPLRSIFIHHRGYLNCLAFNPDGQILAAGSADGTISLWDPTTGQELPPRLTGHKSRVSTIAFSPDGKTLASGITDFGQLYFWDVSTHMLRAGPFECHDGTTVNRIVFSPDGKLLASAGKDTTIMLWPFLPNGQPDEKTTKHLTGHSYWVFDLAFSPDGQTLASGSWDNSLILWDVDTGQIRGTPLRGHADRVLSVAFSPDGQTVASGSRDSSIGLWHVSSNRILTIPNGASGPLVPMDVAIYQRDDPVRQSHYANYVTSIALSPDGQLMVVGMGNRQVSLWEMSTRTLLSVLTGHTSPVWSVAFSPDGKLLASGSGDNEIILWDREHNWLSTFLPTSGVHKARIDSLAFSTDGKLLASGGDVGLVLWNVADRSLRCKLPVDKLPREDKTLHVAFSPQGDVVAAGGENRTITLWNVQTCQFQQQLPDTFDDWVGDIAFSRDGKTFAGGSHDQSLMLWHGETWRFQSRLFTRHSDSVYGIALSPDERSLASVAGNGGLILWDLETGEPLAPPLVQHTNWVRGVAFSPDGKTLVSGGGDGRIIFWDTSDNSRKERACHIANRNMTQQEWRRFLPAESYHKTCPNLS